MSSKNISNSVGDSTSDVILVNTTEISDLETINASNLNISESVSIEGDINANSLLIEEAEIGNISISNNIISLKTGSTLSTIKIIADDISIEGNLSVENTDTVSISNIQTKDLLITDPVTKIALDNSDNISDRGFLLNYIDAVTNNSILGFMGISNEDKIFRLFSSIPDSSISTPNLYYSSTNRSNQTLGNLEIENLLCKKIISQIDGTDLTIESENIIIGTDTGLITMKSNISFEGEALEVAGAATFRDNVTAITDADSPVTITSQESNTVYTVDSSSNAVSFLLPTPVAGLRYKFIVKDTGGNEITITSTSDGSSAASISYANIIAGGTAYSQTTLSDVLTLGNSSNNHTIGDYVECICDGTNWWWSGVVVVASSVVLS